MVAVSQGPGLDAVAAPQSPSPRSSSASVPPAIRAQSAVPTIVRLRDLTVPQKWRRDHVSSWRRRKRHCAELERSDEEQAIADALHQHAESHDDRVYRLNQKIIGIWELIREEEAECYLTQPPT